MVKIKRFVKYLAFVTPILFLLSGCEKQNGPFNSDVKIITDLEVNTNNSDTITYNKFKIFLDIKGSLILEDGHPYEKFDYYTEMPVGYYFKNLKIYPYFKYNDKLDVGDNISDIVEIEYWRGLLINDGSISKYNGLLFNYMYLILSQNPANNGNQRFIVEIDNGAGDILRDTTKTVYLLKD